MCTTCYNSPELSLEEIRSILDQASIWGIEVFNPLGGEPFMRNDIEDILSYAVQRGFYVSITTNGTLISKRRAQRIAQIPSDRLHFNISLDGDRESNDLIRGEGMWERAIEGYRRIREADEAAGNTHRKILANTILHAKNLHNFEEILDEQAHLGFDGVQILNLFRTGEDAPVASKSLWFQSSDYTTLEALSRRLAARAAESRAYRIQNIPQELLQIPLYYQQALKPLEAPCWAGWKELYINADGTAIMCDTQLDFLNGAFGSIREQSLKQIWRSKELKERRMEVKSCTTPCVQKCYLRQSSDSATDLLSDFSRLSAKAIWAKRPSLAKEEVQGGVLRLELSDISPSDSEGSPTPSSRWTVLTRDCPTAPTADNWNHFRDEGVVDFGRGFMGFDLLKELMEGLYRARIQFETVVLGWRGDALLHPEIEVILGYMQDMQRKGTFRCLRIETTGLFVTEKVASFARNGLPQDWVIEMEAGCGAGISLLEKYQGGNTRILLRYVVTDQFPYRSILKRFPDYVPHAGGIPRRSFLHVLWFTVFESDNYRKDAHRNRNLRNVAAQLQIPLQQISREKKRCRAPWTQLVVSWDGKITLCDRDRQLRNMLDDNARLVETWRGLKDTRIETERLGVPQRSFCRDCAYFWNWNGPHGIED